ncbi:MAG: phage/plasmid primase, P4 family [Tannerellaceae bacterium]|nr:phage/plasmid primase, P4 family [Tannerellaceae bacterium]
MVKKILRTAARQVNIEEEYAGTSIFINNLLKELIELLPAIGAQDKNFGWLNFLNGTLRIHLNTAETVFLSHQKEHYLTYILPYEYNPVAKCEEFDAFFKQMQPDKEAREHIWEFLGSCFLPSNTHGKIMIFYGEGGDNGKSTFGKCLPFVLGEKNISRISLSKLAKSETARYNIINKLLIFGNENALTINEETAKVLGRGEEIEVRKLYHQSFGTTCYARLACCVNKLPRPDENSDSFYRRFLIIPWTVEIPREQQIVDYEKTLTIGHEAGILNHILKGLKRLIENKGKIEYRYSGELIQNWKIENNVILRWIYEETLDNIFSETSPNGSEDERISCSSLTNKELYAKFEEWCKEEGIKKIPIMNEVGKTLGHFKELSKGKFNGQRHWYIKR